MKIKDKDIKQTVEVAGTDCLIFKCYWPRPDPGQFIQGQGYQTRNGGNRGWLCGTREARGCPDVKEKRCATYAGNDMGK